MNVTETGPKSLMHGLHFKTMKPQVDNNRLAF